MAKKAVKPAPQQEQKSLEEALTKSEQFFENNKKTIFGVIIAIIVIIAGGMLYNTKVAQPRQLKAAEAIYPGETYFVNGDYSTALNGDAYGFEGFEELSKQYKSTKAGKLAGLYAGLCYANLGKWNEAINYLEKYSPASDQMVGPAAVAALGNAYAHVDQLDKAVQNLKKAAKMADDKAADGINNSIAPTFLVQAAEILEKQGKKDEALAIYQDIKKKYVNASISQEIDKYIERLSVK